MIHGCFDAAVCVGVDTQEVESRFQHVGEDSKSTSSVQRALTYAKQIDRQTGNRETAGIKIEQQAEQ